MSRFDAAFRKRFWSRIKKGPGCWEWQGSRTAAGYGQLQVRKIHQQPLYAHRVAWELEHGPIPRGLHVLHKCDNPPCVRHLFLGTAIDNAMDRVRKGRTASGDRNGSRTRPDRNPFVRNGGSGLRGEEHPMARLSDAQVVRLRRSFDQGEARSVIAERYGISEGHVYCLGRRAIR